MRLVDATGAQPEDVVEALAVAISTTICKRAPDRQTADEWHDMSSGMIGHFMYSAELSGEAVWSRARMH